MAIKIVDLPRYVSLLEARRQIADFKGHPTSDDGAFELRLIQVKQGRTRLKAARSPRSSPDNLGNQNN